MVNSDLLSFIKTSLAQGKTREEISATLRTQGGWTQSNIDEGFATLQTSTSPSIVAAAPVTVNTPQIINQQKKPHNLLWVLIILLIIIALGAGAYYLYFSNSETQQQINVPQVTTPQPVVAQDNPIQQVVASTSDITASSTDVVDCGVSNSNSQASASNFKTFDFEKDKALVCMGENVLNGCINSKATIKANGYSDALMEVKGIKNNCDINLIFSVDDAKLSSNLQCPVGKLIPITMQGKVVGGTTADQLQGKPGKYGEVLFSSDSVALIDGVYKYCSGSAITKAVKSGGE